jgi:hypothetical protein
MLVNKKELIKTSGEVIISGQKASFSYESAENESPANITVNVPVNFMNEAGAGSNGYINLNVSAANMEDAKAGLIALVNGIFAEFNDILTPQA